MEENKAIWDSSALSELDQFKYSVEYKGSDINSKICICSSSKSSSYFIGSLAKNLKQIGSFDVSIYRIEEPTKYANGGESDFTFLQKFSNHVYTKDDVCIVNFVHTDGCYNEIIKSFFDTLKIQEIIVLDSVHQSYFMGDTKAPSMYILSSSDEGPKLPQPNIISGLSAGIITYANVKTIPCKILQMVEEDTGASKESMGIWATYLTKYIQSDISSISFAANRIAEDHKSFMNNLYS
ncbi:hypothetical protein GPJ56_011097 [Histomonas meleagridis]|uniref:uncharacterized protein n=1 Tax=Histomonas meleagridis TaxID=135588 RepID=UPI00355988C0|nr:hypothetical protein GPJ56_011097 [Histomonas meleagridis]KAH0798834.1 hypothetical protein GO595_008699 [Histomonas meleagridis]